MQKYQPGTLIRHKETGKALLVLHVYRVCTIVVDPTDRESFPIPRVLLQKNYPEWVTDKEMTLKGNAWTFDKNYYVDI